MNYLEKAELINHFFGVYGYGHFDINSKEFAELLKFVDQPNAFKKIESFYEELSKFRLG